MFRKNQHGTAVWVVVASLLASRISRYMGAAKPEKLCRLIFCLGLSFSQPLVCSSELCRVDQNLFLWRKGKIRFEIQTFRFMCML